MNQYYPDGWQLVRVKHNLVKIFGSWGGGYLDGDHWRMNSGITKIIEKNSLYNVYGYSGSVYVVHKADEGRLTGYNQSELAAMLEEAELTFPNQIYCVAMEDVIRLAEQYEIEYIKEK